MAYDGTIIIDTEIDAGGFESGLARLEQLALAAGEGLAGALGGVAEHLAAALGEGGGLEAAAGSLLASLSHGLAAGAPQVAGASVPALVGAISGGVSAAAPQMTAAGSGLAAGLAGGFSAGGTRLAGAAPAMVGATVAAFAAGQSTMAGAGRNLVEGLWQGMQGAQGWLMSQIRGLCGQVMAGIKGFFGISSPAKRLADEVGRWLPPGIGEGFAAAMPGLRRSVLRDLARFIEEAGSLVRAGVGRPGAAPSPTGTGGGSTLAGNVYHYTQEVYTHDSLSPYELTQEFENMRAREGWSIP